MGMSVVKVGSTWGQSYNKSNTTYTTQRYHPPSNRWAQTDKFDNTFFEEGHRETSSPMLCRYE